ncbi:MAG: nucleoside-triphosphatase [Bacillota bacterium]|jgi:nucleoside-triphosphatase THEP1
MYMFLQGPPRIGKSTILRNALLPWQTTVAGLMVQRLREDGEICGYRACAVHGELPTLEIDYVEHLDGVFLYRRKSFPEVLDRTISRARVLCAKDGCEIIILDEIGGLELSSPAFMESLETIMALGKPCLGVLKSQENLARVAARVGMPSRVFRLSENLYRRIEAGGKILEVSENNLAETAQTVADFLVAVRRN